MKTAKLSKLLSLSACAVALVLECGCNNDNSTPVPPQTSTTTNGAGTNMAANPLNQGQTDADKALSQKIRDAIQSSTNNYSTEAKNVTISTVNGKVTLSGQVNSNSDKTGIKSIADSVAGNDNVKDELTVK